MHSCYGEELGLTSDDEDYVSSTGMDEEAVLNLCQNLSILVCIFYRLNIYSTPLVGISFNILINWQDLPAKTPETAETPITPIITTTSVQDTEPTTSKCLLSVKPSVSQDNEINLLSSSTEGQASINGTKLAAPSTADSGSVQTDLSDSSESDADKCMSIYFKFDK